MTEAELRALVRDAIARHRSASRPEAPEAARTSSVPSAAVSGRHASHGMFVLPAGDGACLIEPSVGCNHCGYCKSYGH